MLGHFPTPYPDELLYSVCARYDQLMCYPNKKALLLEMFGSANAIAVVDLPSHLGHLAGSIPNNDYYSVQKLIDHHTLLPYYSPFLELPTVKRLHRQMRGSKGSSIHTRAGIMASRIRSFQYLRYCPTCAEEDRLIFGETYWHRIHQAPGVEVCEKHTVFLMDSGVRVHNAQNRHVFFSAQGVVGRVPVRVVDETDRSHQILLRLSRSAAWLLDCPNLMTSDLASIRTRYLSLLADRGLATYSGRVHAAALLKEFTDYYHQSVLSYLGSLTDEFTSSTPTWLPRLVRSPRSAQHPLHHLLFMGFLNQTPHEFFSRPVSPNPFGAAPYPCLNGAGDHFSELLIKECRITYTKDYGKPVGTFRCGCGFSYMRTGPDKNSDDRHRIDRMEAFGDVWTAALKLMWGDSSVSLRQMSQRLGVDPLTVKRQATVADLRFPRTAPRSAQMQSTPTRARTLKLATNAKELYREKWLSVGRSNPEAGTTQVRSLTPGTYAWLRRNDCEWLRARVLPPQERSAVSGRIDWEQRDERLADATRKASIHLRNSEGRPVKITVARIARSIGHLALIQKHLRKLPKTARALKSVADTRESFAVRRINYIAQLYESEGTIPKRWQLIRRAGLRPEIVADATAVEAISAAMNGLSVSPRQREVA